MDRPTRNTTSSSVFPDVPEPLDTQIDLVPDNRTVVVERAG
ncbi:hypothetical protein ACFQ46_21030 [Kineococcus sp. GCM10028916]